MKPQPVRAQSQWPSYPNQRKNVRKSRVDDKIKKCMSVVLYLVRSSFFPFLEKTETETGPNNRTGPLRLDRSYPVNFSCRPVSTVTSRNASVAEVLPSPRYCKATGWSRHTDYCLRGTRVSASYLFLP
jgi:hypothetical protein